MTSLFQMELQNFLAAERHAIAGHRMTFETLPDGRVYWKCLNDNSHGLFVRDLTEVA